MQKVSITAWIAKKLKRCLGIVQDTDTATQNITEGKFVIWKGNAHTANQAISSGDTLSAAGGGNLDECPDGIANALNSKIATKQDKIIELYTSAYVSASGGTAKISLPSGTNYKNVRIMYAYLYVGSNDPRYYHTTAIGLTVQSDGILVRNDGGAAGIIHVGIIIVDG